MSYHEDQFDAEMASLRTEEDYGPLEDGLLDPEDEDWYAVHGEQAGNVGT